MSSTPSKRSYNTSYLELIDDTPVVLTWWSLSLLQCPLRCLIVAIARRLGQLIFVLNLTTLFLFRGRSLIDCLISGKYQHDFGSCFARRLSVFILDNHSNWLPTDRAWKRLEPTVPSLTKSHITLHRPFVSYITFFSFLLNQERFITVSLKCNLD